jgi:hypothetical protein
MESVNILLIAILVLLCIGFICMYIISIKFVREILIELANKIKSIDNKIDFIDNRLDIILNNSLSCINRIQELDKTIYSIYDNHIKVIENYTKYCATSIARKHKSNKNKTNTKQQ